MKKMRHYSDRLKPKTIDRVDKAIVETATLLLDGKRVPFNIADLFEIKKYHEEKSNSLTTQKWTSFESITSFGVFSELEEFTDEEIVALVAERLEILATRPTNRLFCKAEIAGYYYVI